MPSFPSLALAGLALCLACALASASGKAVRWQVPALLSAGFLAYTLWPVTTMGPLGFWPRHVSDAWSVQIWFDLLCALGVGFALLAPRARAAGLSPWPWLALIVATGSIGLLAMLAGVLHRESAAGRPALA